MPVTLKLAFPAGRYHATLWGRHVNEGVPEWPPSPWRLLRALVAVWRRTCPDLPEPQVRRLLEALLTPPRFRLPEARFAHTRHYMPLGKASPVNLKSSDTTKVFDTFVTLDRGAHVLVGWPDADLAADDQAALERIVRSLTFLGRAESWVDAELVDQPVCWNCEPAVDDDNAPVPVLCADPLAALDGAHYPSHEPKKLKKGLAPGDLLFDCPSWHLCLDTQTLHARRWPRVPGSIWVPYTRPRPTPPVRSAPRERPHPTFARYALDGPVLPRVTDTLPFAERTRSRLLTLVRDLAGCDREQLPEQAPAFWGKDALGRPLRRHRHAFFLPVDEDGDGFLDHLVVFALGGFDPDELRGLDADGQRPSSTTNRPGGFTSDELRALDRLRHLRFGENEFALALVGLGRPEDFARSRLLGPSTEWISATPFVAPRHLKRRGRKRDPSDWFQAPGGPAAFLLATLGEELDRRDALGAPRGRLASAEITPLAGQDFHRGRHRPHEFHVRRGKSTDDGHRRPRGLLRLRFLEPIPGPIALGHSCHFGLGLFLSSS